MRETDPSKCNECKRADRVPNVLPYLFYDAQDNAIMVWLHQGCSQRKYEKYREWRKEIQDGA